MLGVVVDRRTAAHLRAFGVRAMIDAQARRDGGAVPPELQAFFDELAALAMMDSSPSVEREPVETEWLSTAEAARRLGTNDRRVRRMIERRDLVHRRRSGVLEVTADSVAEAQNA